MRILHYENAHFVFITNNEGSGNNCKPHFYVNKCPLHSSSLNKTNSTFIVTVDSCWSMLK